MNKLSIKGLALGAGAAWAFCILLGGWMAMFGWGGPFVEVMSSIYIGYDATFFGGIVGALWAFVDAAIFGVILAFVYNLTAKS